MSIDGRKKKGYITGRKVASVEDDPNYNEWEVEDALVKSWLINSMTDQLMSHFVLNQVSGRVLATTPLPSLKEAYSLVHREEQRQVTRGTKDHFEASAMAIHKNST
ncbi:hypothetical protein CK203_061910 [Vitis vinifera]|uniref:Uncharacterized protein n=1 Tax=Vitis vinifera TaxID=29760 RepID=A0A438GCL1_VITVI|nr:hypothetical protein CK203_061910 [Vitis vinifera]